MNTIKKLFFIVQIFCIQQIFVYADARNVYCAKKIKKQRIMHKAARFFGEIIVDALMLNVNLFSMTSIYIVTGATPFYLAARMSDERIQQSFYDNSCHKNIRQLPKECHDAAHYGIGIPMVFLSSLALWGWNEDLRTTARIYAIGLPFVHSGKDIIKKLRFKSCLRPWHESFGKERRSSGGFPSGHMANVTYMTALFGMRHGPAWGIPLGLFASFVFVDFLNCNRHYFSQLIAGAGLGLLFAFAADTIVTMKLEARWKAECHCDSAGAPTFKLAYMF